MISLCLIMMYSCDSETGVPQPDTDHINLDYQLVRYEQLLEEIDADDPVKGYQELKQKHPEFTELYFKRLVPLIDHEENVDSIRTSLFDFLNDPRITYLLDTVQMVHNEFDKETVPKLNQAFKNLKFYFPRWTEPNVYTLITEYAYQHFVFEDGNGRDGLGIGLDMYLGRDFPYSRVAPGVAAFSEYITRSFDKSHMVKKILDVLMEEIMGPPPGARMLDQMIHNGKKHYIIQHLLPSVPDSVIMEYTSQQMEWVSQNEEEMWAFFFKEELFYETNMIDINKYINTSPNSPGMPDEAPGRTGNYMGWQIIKSYMKRNPDMSMEELLMVRDAQKIMDQSRYKPRRN
ncbi:MAG: hypothetical protein HKN68_10210 [Saprospiraceae bacterium]|nr:hypothetical protein [Saprospiraceae bacterium]